MSVKRCSGQPNFDLDEMAGAQGYQRWMLKAVLPYLGSRVLELGAGLGNLSRILPVGQRLILTEPDPRFLSRLESGARQWFGRDRRVCVARFDPSRDPWQRFARENLDTVVSFNVLEHIRDDGKVLEAMKRLLRSSRARGPKRLVTLVPAHAWAFGSLDQANGHFRRYDRSSFRALAMGHAPEARLRFRSFNFVGLLGWWFAGRILRRPRVDTATVDYYERLLPFIRTGDELLTRVLRLPLGQSLIAVLEWD